MAARLPRSVRLASRNDLGTARARTNSPAKGHRAAATELDGAQTIRLADCDPELFQQLEPVAFERARRVAVARVREFRPGACDFRQESPTRPHYGLLLLRGLLIRRVEVASVACCELVGPGDVLRPWLDCGPSSPVPAHASWRALVSSSAAILDDEFAAAIRVWPQLPAALMDRLLLRTRWLEFQLAICGGKRVEERLRLILWQFAYRWGRVVPDGVALRLPLTHRQLAEVVGAERPTVTTALGSLRAEGLLEPLRAPRGWLLKGNPPSEVRSLQAAADGA